MGLSASKYIWVFVKEASNLRAKAIFTLMSRFFCLVHGQIDLQEPTSCTLEIICKRLSAPISSSFFFLNPLLKENQKLTKNAHTSHSSHVAVPLAINRSTCSACQSSAQRVNDLTFNNLIGVWRTHIFSPITVG